VADVALPRPSVDEAYAEVQRLTRRRARNFAYGIMVLPRPKRRAIAAIYAFARLVDDIADGDLAVRAKRERLEELDRQLDAPPDGEALWVALADARARYPIPARALHDFVDGGLQDLTQTRYSDFDELSAYCRRVAGAVGVACTAVYGADQPQRAETLGIALQLINIMRDVDEDWRLGRVYLPQDELASFGISEDDIAARRCSSAWQALMAYQAARARAYLEEGLTLLGYLDRRSAACVGTFAGLYRATLERIEKDGFDVFGGPPQLSAATKLRIVASALL
jgi:phytoene synthase